VAKASSGVTGATPLFSALLNYLHSTGDLDAGFADAAGITVLASQGGTNYPFVLSVAGEGDSFVLDMKTDSRIDARRMRGLVEQALHSLTDALEKSPDSPVLALPVLPDAERSMLEAFNATRAPYPREKTIHALFEAQVRENPDGDALIGAGRQLSYLQLNQRANQLARYLGRHGVGPGHRVALYMRRGVDVVSAMLGTLKSGAAYVPLETSYPQDRVRYLLEDAAPTVVLTTENLMAGLPATGAVVIALDGHESLIAAESTADVDQVDLSSEALAYVMYTSGSTGTPKGVMVRHRNVVNYATHIAQALDITAGEGSLIGTSLNFDLSLTGLFPPLICGRPVRVCGEDEDVARHLEDGHAYAPVKLTPSHLSLLTRAEEQVRGRVKVLVLGGEVLHGSAVREWWRHSPETRIFNHYGPTETTIGCIVNEIDSDVEGPVPLGQPIGNTQIHILDAHLRQVPVGAVGEIHIGGEGVSAGYWNRPELTAQRFIPDTFCGELDRRLYRTGDLGRWRADGKIEYLGRNDQQVKLRGFRVELGEIEAHLWRHPVVKDSVVVVREVAAGDQRLVAYVTSTGESVPTAVELRAHLKPFLPEYMIPGAFVSLKQLPITPNGKLDRHALPEPELGSLATRAYEAPESDTEAALADIWQRLLLAERVGRDDDFFALGGHSLHGVKLVGAVSERFGITLPVISIFRHPTVREMAAAIDEISAFDEGVLESSAPIAVGAD
jgi:amino acid adenylation domain-containing protein